jgi:hypothetical protein
MSAQHSDRPRPTTQVDPEEIQTTRSEKLLAFVLAGFLLVGGLWFYFNLDDIPDEPSALGIYGETFGSESDRTAVNRHQEAQFRLQNARSREQARRRDLEDRREAYRTALDAGRPAAELEQSYQRAQSAYEDARLQTRERQAAVTRLAPAAREARSRVAVQQRQAQREFDDKRRDHDRNTFLLRLVYVLLTAAAGYWLLGRIRGRRPRYLVLALAFVGFAALQAIVMAVDYSSDYIDYRDAGLLTISLAGIAMTVAAFIALQRYLAQRVPQRRVRKRECPFCGFPVTDNDRCEGCGRDVFAQCSNCASRRRVGTAYCGACGAP